MSTDPAQLRIVTYPHAALREPAKPVGAVTDEVRAIADRMVELMFEAEGIGLAAPQVGLPLRLFVCHVPEADERSATASPVTATAHPTVYIDPVITSPEGPILPMDEGCLSLPDITGEVLRPEHVTIEATNLHGDRFTHTGEGLLARCWQHELDHLDAVLIIDKMTQLSRLKNRSAIRRLERSA